MLIAVLAIAIALVGWLDARAGRLRETSGAGSAGSAAGAGRPLADLDRPGARRHGSPGAAPDRRRAAVGAAGTVPVPDERGGDGALRPARDPARGGRPPRRAGACTWGVAPLAALVLLVGSVPAAGTSPRRRGLRADVHPPGSRLACSWWPSSRRGLQRPTIKERNLFFLAPPLMVALLASFSAGPFRWRTRALVAAGAGLLPLVVPYASYLDQAAATDTLALFPLWLAEQRTRARGPRREARRGDLCSCWGSCSCSPPGGPFRDCSSLTILGLSVTTQVFLVPFTREHARLGLEASMGRPAELDRRGRSPTGASVTHLWMGTGQPEGRLVERVLQPQAADDRLRAASDRGHPPPARAAARGLERPAP